MLLETPGKWWTLTKKLCFIERSKRNLMRSIYIRGVFEWPELIMATTNSLSHQNLGKRNARSLREKGLPYGEVLKKFLVEPYMVKTAGSPPGKVNQALQKGSTRNDCLTREYWRVPISDWSSTKRTEQRFVKEVSKSRVHCSLSSWRLASMWGKFNSMPMNSST